MKLRYTPETISDLQEIKRYIKNNLHNPTAALRISKAILAACSSLKSFPKMGMSIKSKAGFETDLRMLTCENWVAVYRIEDESGMISVARIMDARQDYMRILFGEIDFVPTIEESGDKDHQPGPVMTK
jgi:Plasmid stabilization system protein